MADFEVGDKVFCFNQFGKLIGKATIDRDALPLYSQIRWVTFEQNYDPYLTDLRYLFNTKELLPVTPLTELIYG